MSVEDRERMMRSRALPEHFTMGQSSGPVLPQPPPSSMLMQPYGGPRFGDMRPLSLDTMNRGGRSDSTYTSPTSVTPALGAFSFTPPQSAGVAHSPGAMGLDNRGYGFRSVAASPRAELLSPSHGATASFSSSFPSGLSQLPTLDRQRHASVDYQSSGIRPGLAPFPGAIPPSVPLGQPQDRRSSLVQPSGGAQREMGPPSSLVGLGFACKSAASVRRWCKTNNMQSIVFRTSKPQVAQYHSLRRPQDKASCCTAAQAVSPRPVRASPTHRCSTTRAAQAPRGQQEVILSSNNSHNSRPADTAHPTHHRCPEARMVRHSPRACSRATAHTQEHKRHMTHSGARYRRCTPRRRSKENNRVREGRPAAAQDTENDRKMS